MRIRGDQLVEVILSISDWDSAPYEEVAWETFRRIRTAGHTVQFPDILVELDRLRDVDTELSRTLKRVVKLLDKVEENRKLQRSRVVLAPKEDIALPRDTSPPPRPIPIRGMGLLDSLRQESCIRIYVETGSNKGHQSASVTLARKLVRWLQRDPKSKVNPKLVIEFLCNDKDALGKTQSIIGGKADSLEGISVKVKTWGSFFGPSAVNFAFSGAIDDPLVTYGKLNAKCLIGLQPMGWAGGAELVIAEGPKSPRYTVLTQASGHGAEPATDAIEFPIPFKRLPFAEPASQGAPSWSPSDRPDRLVAQIFDLAELSQSTKRPIFVCPLYGMGKGQPMEEYGACVWTNVGSALLELTKRSEFPGSIVLLNLSKDLGSNPPGTWGAVSRFFESERAVRVETRGVTGPDIANIFESLSGEHRLCICSVLDNKDGRSMDRAYRTSRLPPIFEGQGSLTQVITMGRPFIKLSSRAAVDPAWPSDYLPVEEFKGVDERIQQVSNTIVNDWRKQLNSGCLHSLTDLLWDMFAEGSEVQQYFQACREIATDLSYDRLCWAAEALARLLAPSKQARDLSEPRVEMSLRLGTGLSSVSSLKKDSGLIKAERQFTESIGRRLKLIENPGGGDCLYYAFDDGMRQVVEPSSGRLAHATRLRCEAAALTARLIERGFGLCPTMLSGMDLFDRKVLDLIEPAMEKVQDLRDTFFQVARIEIGMGPDEVFAHDNDPRMLRAQAIAARMVRDAIARDPTLRQQLGQIAQAYADGQGRPAEWAGELEYYGLVLHTGVNLRIHYLDASPSAVESGNTHRVVAYDYQALSREWLGVDAAPAVLTIDIAHINGGTHYVYGIPRQL